MSERDIIADKLKKKLQEIQTLEEKVRAAKVYVQALQDILKSVDKVEDNSQSDKGPKAGSAVSQARDVILQACKPVHVDELLTALGKDGTREAKASLTSSLAAYVRRGEIFSRPAPNTFGLIELGHANSGDLEEPVPPAGFGREPEADEEAIVF